MFSYKKLVNRFPFDVRNLTAILLIVALLIGFYFYACGVAEKNHEKWLDENYGNKLQQQSAIDYVGKQLKADPHGNIHVPDYVLLVENSDIAGVRYCFIGSNDLYYYGRPEEYDLLKIEAYD